MSLVGITDRPIYLATTPVDFRKQINGLLQLVETQFAAMPNTAIFVFLNRSQDKAKVLLWDGNGFMLLYKQLERGRFCLHRIDEDHYALREQQLRWLLSGHDWVTMSGLFQPNLTCYQ